MPQAQPDLQTRTSTLADGRTVVTRRVHAPADDVWSVLADGWRYANWVVGASRIREVDPQWPEPGPFVGREAFAEFLNGFRGAWEEDRLDVDNVEELGALLVARCRWTLSGVASGAAVPARFTILVRLEPNGLATSIAAFFDHDEALRWAESEVA